MNATLPAAKRIGILVFEDFEPIDVWGFCEAFSIARFLGTDYSPLPKVPFELVFIANVDGPESGTPPPVRSYKGPRVAPDVFRNQALRQGFDVLMVPGGAGVSHLFSDARQLEAVLSWLKQMDKSVPLMTSVCTGAALLAKAGLLDHLPATSNHQALSWVAQQGPLVLWDNVLRWVDAGKYVTSAGVSAGTDMAFYLVSRLAGRAVAEIAALTAEYGWHRDPAQPIYYPPQASIS